MDTSSKVLWLNQICDCEYAWNTAAPGGEPFDGVYYDAERDHTEPPEIINDWLPAPAVRFSAKNWAMHGASISSRCFVALYSRPRWRSGVGQQASSETHGGC